MYLVSVDPMDRSEVTKIQKCYIIIVDILQGQDRKKWKENHTTK